MKKILFISAIVFGSITDANSQIINGGFEAWTADLPDGWWAFDLQGYDLYAQSTSAHSGSYAVSLRVDTLNGNAVITTLSTGDGGNFNTHPLSSVPGSVNFWYRLDAVGNDIVVLSAIVYSGSTAVGSAYVPMPATANYTMATAPIYYGISPPATADSIALIFVVSNQTGTPNAGSQAWIDDVSLSASTAIDEIASSGFQLMPNPAHNQITITMHSANENQDIYITDVAGRMIYHAVSSDDTHIVKTLDFMPGFYHCLVKSGDKEYRKPFIVKHP